MPLYGPLATREMFAWSFCLVYPFLYVAPARVISQLVWLAKRVGMDGLILAHAACKGAVWRAGFGCLCFCLDSGVGAVACRKFIIRLFKFQCCRKLFSSSGKRALGLG